MVTRRRSLAEIRGREPADQLEDMRSLFTYIFDGLLPQYRRDHGDQIETGYLVTQVYPDYFSEIATIRSAFGVRNRINYNEQPEPTGAEAVRAARNMMRGIEAFFEEHGHYVRPEIAQAVMGTAAIADNDGESRAGHRKGQTAARTVQRTAPQSGGSLPLYIAIPRLIWRLVIGLLWLTRTTLATVGAVVGIGVVLVVLYVAYLIFKDFRLPTIEFGRNQTPSPGTLTPQTASEWYSFNSKYLQSAGWEFYTPATLAHLIKAPGDGHNKGAQRLGPTLHVRKRCEADKLVNIFKLPPGRIPYRAFVEMDDGQNKLPGHGLLYKVVPDAGTIRIFPFDTVSTDDMRAEFSSTRVKEFGGWLQVTPQQTCTISACLTFDP